jgi:ATPase subunit of ABC transporter with duplicated ATPase domains
MSAKIILSFEDFQEHLKTLKNVPKYDSSTEEKTPHAYWDLDKPTIQSLLKDISEKVDSCIQGATGLDKELQHVVNTSTKLEQVERDATVKVALIGAQGAGKSLLINALFDCTGLSLTGAKGFACTSAIVKYAYGQGDKFSAEVRFLNAKTREQMIDEHIRSYLDYHNDLQDSDDEGGGRRT